MPSGLETLKGEPAWSDAAALHAVDHLTSTELTHALSLNAAANFSAAANFNASAAGGIAGAAAAAAMDHEASTTASTAKDIYSWF